MSAVKQERMTKGTKARKAAKRRLPKLLNKRRRSELTAMRKAKRPGPPRLLQRQWKLAARAKAKKAAAEKQSLLAKWLGNNVEITVTKESAA
jgi:hypothetical protein